MEPDIPEVELPEAHLGKTRKRIQVHESGDGLTIDIPHRRDRQSVFIAVLLLAPLSWNVLRFLVAIAFILPGVPPSELPSLLLTFVAFLAVAAFTSIPWILLGVVGLYHLLGSTQIDISKQRIAMRKRVGSLRGYYGGMDLGLALPEVSAVPNPQAKWLVRVTPASRLQAGRPLEFGTGEVTRSQAEALAAAISEFLRRDNAAVASHV